MILTVNFKTTLNKLIIIIIIIIIIITVFSKKNSCNTSRQQINFAKRSTIDYERVFNTSLKYPFTRVISFMLTVCLSHLVVRKVV